MKRKMDAIPDREGRRSVRSRMAWLLVLCMSTALMLSSCGKPEQRTKTAESTGNGKTAAAQKIADEMIRVDLNEAKTERTDGTSGQFIADLILAHAEMKVLEAGQQQWRVRITAPNMEEIAENTRKEAAVSVSDPADIEAWQNSVEELLAGIEKQLETGKYKLLETEMALEVADGKPVLDDAAVDALYGGLLTVYGKLLEEYEEAMDHEIR